MTHGTLCALRGERARPIDRSPVSRLPSPVSRLPSPAIAPFDRLDPRRAPRLASLSLPRRADCPAGRNGGNPGGRTPRNRRRAAPSARTHRRDGDRSHHPRGARGNAHSVRHRALALSRTGSHCCLARPAAPHPAPRRGHRAAPGPWPGQRAGPGRAVDRPSNRRIAGGHRVRNALRIGAAVPEWRAGGLRASRPTLRGGCPHAGRPPVARLPPGHVATVRARPRGSSGRHVGARRQRVRCDRDHHVQSQDSQRPELRPVHQLWSA
jgi:hypothetical protein